MLDKKFNFIALFKSDFLIQRKNDNNNRGSLIIEAGSEIKIMILVLLN